MYYSCFVYICFFMSVLSLEYEDCKCIQIKINFVCDIDYNDTRSSYLYYSYFTLTTSNCNFDFDSNINFQSVSILDSKIMNIQSLYNFTKLFCITIQNSNLTKLFQISSWNIFKIFKFYCHKR